MIFDFNCSKKLVIPLIGAPSIQLTNTTLKQNLTDANIQIQSLKEIEKRFRPDAILTFMDLTVEAEALGLKINFPDNEPPSVVEHPIKVIEDLKLLKESYKGISSRMNTFIEVVRLMKKEISSLKGAYVIGPFTLAGELMGVNDLAINTILEPDLVNEVIDFCITVISNYANALFDAGADFVVVLEPSAVMLSPEQYVSFSQKPFRKIAENVSNKPLILHICGNTTHLIKDMCSSKAVGLSIDSDVDLKEVAKIIPDNIAIIGNIHPVNSMIFDTPEEVIKKVKKLKEEMKDYNNFILSTGCDIPVNAHLENIDAFMKGAR